MSITEKIARRNAAKAAGTLPSAHAAVFGDATDPADIKRIAEARAAREIAADPAKRAW